MNNSEKLHFITKLKLIIIFLALSQLCFAQVSGTIFRDYNGNGSQDANEPLVSGVTVNIYNVSEAVCGTALSSGTTAPNYTVTGCSGQLRVEFELPTSPAAVDFGPEAGIDFSALNGAAYGTSVQYVNEGTSNVDYALTNPEQFWDNTAQPNPAFFIPCYVSASTTEGPNDRDALVMVEYTDNGADPTVATQVAEYTEVGSVWGVGYQTQEDRFFTAAFLKRHSGYGPLGAGGIYMAEGGNGGTGYTMSGQFDLQGVTPSNGGPAIDFGTVDRSGTNQADDNYVGVSPNRDLDAFGKIGMRSYGDVAIDDQNNHLYAINLFQKSLIKLDVSDNTTVLNGASAATLGALTESYDILSLPGAPAGCTGGELRPFAVEIYRGDGYLSLTCDALSSQNASNLYGYILKFDPNNISAGFSTVIDFDFSYYNSDGGWRAWTDDFAQTGITASCCTAFPYAQPLISNIRFGEDGNMLLAFMNRWGHQLGAGQYAPISGSTTLMQGRAYGDVQRVCYNSGTDSWQFCDITNTPVANPVDGNSSNEIYDDDAGDGSVENSVGAVLPLWGSGRILSAVADPFPPGGTPGSTYYASGGIHWNNLQTGARDQWLRLFNELWQVNLAKSAGLGDMSWALELPPLEIGNRVWIDTNSDGIQTADEAGVDGLTVELYQGSTLVGQTITSNGGQWFFNDSNVNLGGATGLLPNTAYFIRINSSEFPAAAPVLTSTGTATGQADQRDNDASLMSGNAEIAYTTGNLGENDHSLDIGFRASSCVPPSVVLASSQGTCTGGAANNDASVSLSSVMGGDEANYSTGATYSGPVYGTAGNIDVSGGSGSFTGLMHNTQYTVRVFNGSNDCFIDQTITTSGITCTALTYSLGNRVFYDDDISGDQNGTEAGIDGIMLQLLNSNGTVYDSDPSMGGIQALTVTTGNGGYYRFDDLPAGDYIVEVMAAAFSGGGTLETYSSSDGAAQENSPNNNGDLNDNGLDTPVSGAIRSGIVSLGGAEPTGEAEPGTYAAGSTTGTAAADTESNLTVDFGFYRQRDRPDYDNPDRPPCPDEPCHFISNNIYFGSGVTNDGSSSGSSSADSDVDDGLLWGDDINAAPGGSLNLPIEIYNVTGSDAYFRMWIDWNGDGDFEDGGEQVADELYLTAVYSGTFTVYHQVNIPANALSNQDLALRMRLSTDDTNTADPCGNGNCANDGEIEDYLLRVTCPISTCTMPGIILTRN